MRIPFSPAAAAAAVAAHTSRGIKVARHVVRIGCSIQMGQEKRKRRGKRKDTSSATRMPSGFLILSMAMERYRYITTLDIVAFAVDNVDDPLCATTSCKCHDPTSALHQPCK